MEKADQESEAIHKSAPVGYTCLLVLVFGFIAEQFFLQNVLTRTGFDKPLFVALFNNLFILLFLIKSFVMPNSNNSVTDQDYQDPNPPPKSISLVDEKYNYWTSFFIGCKIAPLFFVDIILYSIALMHLTIPTASLVTSFAVVVAYVGSVGLRRERFTWKTVGAVLAMMACTLVVYSITPTDQLTGRTADEPIGYVLAVGGAFSYGIISILMSYYSDPYMIGAECVNEDALFGGQAVVGCVAAVPLLVLAHYTGIEEFELPSWNVLRQIACLGGIITPLLVYSFGRASMVLSPAVVQAASACGSPIATLIDQLCGYHSYPRGYVMGMIGMVFCCFIASMVIERTRKEEIAENLKKLEQNEQRLRMDLHESGIETGHLSA